MTTYMNVATFTIAKDYTLGVDCFGVWYRNDAMSYCVSTRGVPLMERFDNQRAAVLFFNLTVERLKIIAAQEEADFQRHALEVEQPDQALVPYDGC